MAKGDENVSAQGFSNLAHAIRRSTALYVAMTVTPPDSSIEDMLVNADVLAEWLRGKAGQQEEEMAEGQQGRTTLGVRFDERETYEG